MDAFVRLVYKLTKKFPKDELYGMTSQLRRASLSIILNYIEGFARRKPAVQLNFMEIAYGSLRESKYLLYLSQIESYITKDDYGYGIKIAEEIGAMLWTEIMSLEKSIKNI